ncbi:Lipid A core - O-antigen ligase-related enzymes [Comamonas testosteroni TK102]|uniref:Lipid A core-O-antigen ligase-related enzymes n=3 Tax=Comamonas TaxID=283 RepID=A0A076PS52_COMTE|nr:Lipid A core - O-antigen ligase-related enzymes [Comamonas testosteroni TK102]
MYAAISEKPFIGWGWLNLGAAQQNFTVNIGGAENMDHAHNLFLDLMIWFGVPVGGVIAIALIFWMVRSLHGNIIAKGNEKSVITSQCAILLILPIAVHSMLEYPFAYMYFMLPCVFFMGVVEGNTKFLKLISSNFKKLIWIFIFLSLVLSVVVGREYLKIENDFRASLLEEQFYTKDDELHQYASSSLILSQYQGLVKVLRTTPSSDIDEENVESARIISKRFPWLITMRQYYLFLLKMGKCDEAKNQELIIESFFGRFGILKAEEYSIKYNLTGICN